MSALRSNTPTPPCSNSWRRKNEFWRWNISGKNCQPTSINKIRVERRPMLPMNQSRVLMMFQKFNHSLLRSLEIEENMLKLKESNRIITFCSKKKDTPKIPFKYPTSTTPPNLFPKIPPPQKKSPEIWVSWMTWRSLPLFYSTPQLAHEDFDSQRKPRQMRSHVLL